MAETLFQTRSDLITFIAQQLNVLAVGQTLSDDDYNIIDVRIDPANQMLSAKNIAYLDDTDNIPGAWFEPFGNYVGGKCARAFGLTGQALADVQALAIQGQNDLYALARSRSTRQVAAIESFWGYPGYGWRR